MDTALTELVVLAPAILAQEERPFQTPFLAPAHASVQRCLHPARVSAGLSM